jgi:hypothetical protein
VRIADPKPLIRNRWATSEQVGGGAYQVDNYVAGFTAFATQARADSGGALANVPDPTLSGPLRTTSTPPLVIPPMLDYREFAAQQSAAGVQIGAGDYRLWLYEVQNGIIVYFPLDRVAPSDQRRRTYELLIADLLGLRAQLRRDPALRASTRLTLASKRRPGAPVRRRVLQRQPNWPALGAQWELDRRRWADRSTAFLEGPGRELRRRLEVDRALGISRRDPATRRDEGADYRSLLFWSGPIGRLAGQLRFRLGPVVDSATAFIRDVAARFRAWIAAIDPQRVVTGLLSAAVRVIVAAVRRGVGRFLGETYALFSRCLQRALSAAVDRVVNRAERMLPQRLADFVERVSGIVDQVRGAFSTVFSVYDRITGLIAQVRATVGRLADLIRTGFEIISCLSPPGIGCVVGLAQRLALDFVARLVARTRWFEDRILRSDAVWELIRPLIEPAQRRLVHAAFARLGLADLLPPHCVPEAGALTRAEVLASPDAADDLAARQEWEATHGSEIAGADPAVGAAQRDAAHIIRLLESAPWFPVYEDTTMALFERQARSPRSLAALVQALRPRHRWSLLGGYSNYLEYLRGRLSARGRERLDRWLAGLP